MEDVLQKKLEGLFSEDKSDGIVKFDKPFEFEGQTYTEVDISAVENLSGARIAQLEKLFYKMGHNTPLAEMSIAYTMIVAANATDHPLAFFEQLPAKEATKVKFAVSNFLLG